MTNGHSQDATPPLETSPGSDTPLSQHRATSQNGPADGATPTLLEQSLGEANLFAAWERVRANGGGAGVDGQSIEMFAQNVFGRLQTLRDQVRRNEYLPAPLLQVAIPKDDGRLRHLAIPTVRDRVLQTTLAQVITPLLDRGFEHVSYGYRKGRSVQMAVARVAWLRDQGYHWVVDADIESYFDNIDHDLLIEHLKRALPDPSPLRLIELWLAATIQPADGGQPYLLSRGVPQGSPISPVLANLFLDPLDEALLGAGFQLVRFADDFVILCRERDEAEQALALTRQTLAALKLRLNADKTRLVHFNEGFHFLGVDFIRNLLRPADPAAAPWVLPNDAHLARAGDEETATPARPVDPQSAIIAEAAQSPEEDESIVDATLEEETGLSPLLRTLVVTTPGVTVLKENDRVVITKAGSAALTWPLRRIDEIHIISNALISTALLRYCAREGITVVFSDAQAIRHAHLAAAEPVAEAQTHAQQWQRSQDAAWCLMVARAIVEGKISNQITLLRRYNRSRGLDTVSQACERLQTLRARLPYAREINQVRGIEGQCAREYFAALRALIPEQWPFPGRRRRPPTDPVNALLSYGYAVLYRHAITMLQRVRLDPALGTLHAPRSGHAALASDLIEEFRAPVVDAVVLHATLAGTLRPEDFVQATDERGLAYPALGETARRRYLEMLRNKLRAALIHPAARVRMDYQRAMLWQADHYRHVVLGEEPVYRPFVLR